MCSDYFCVNSKRNASGNRESSVHNVYGRRPSARLILWPHKVERVTCACLATKLHASYSAELISSIRNLRLIDRERMSRKPSLSAPRIDWRDSYSSERLRPLQFQTWFCIKKKKVNLQMVSEQSSAFQINI